MPPLQQLRTVDGGGQRRATIDWMRKRMLRNGGR
jgi:hypothetical protein